MSERSIKRKRERERERKNARDREGVGMRKKCGGRQFGER